LGELAPRCFVTEIDITNRLDPELIDDRVGIAIGGLSIDVVIGVPLQARREALPDVRFALVFGAATRSCERQAHQADSAEQ